MRAVTGGSPINMMPAVHDSFLMKEIWTGMLRARLIEERMLNLLRQGKISKWFSGIGQEAIAVGSTMALQKSDWILPLHRNLGVFTSRGLPLDKLFLQLQGRAGGYTGGRDRSFHFGAPEHRIVGMISHLGAMLGVADGLALAGKLADDESIALVFSGDGGTSQGDFHEALNLASVWDLPVIFLVENNGYALSTPTSKQFRCENLADRASGYGMEGVTIDGNDAIEVYQTVSHLAERARGESRPFLLEAMTFRMRGHEEASGVAYVPDELIDHWAERDPIRRLEEKLNIEPSEREEVRMSLKSAIDEAVEIMLNAPDPEPDPDRELARVFAPAHFPPVEPPEDSGQEIRFIEAVSEGLAAAMRRNSRVVLMGQDVGHYGGVFKITRGFLEEFGEERVRDTPLCESAVVAAAMGLALRGFPAIMEMQFADFVSNGFNQIVNNLAKTYYRWGSSLNVTIRMPTGGGVGAGPFHSQSDESWFTSVPGLKVAFPSNPRDAKGLLTSAVRDPNPVLYFEHKNLYRSVKGLVPTEYFEIPFGQARVDRIGDRLTVVTYGQGVRWARDLAEAHREYGIEVIDLRTLIPWDVARICESVKKTGRALVLHEATMTSGFGAEVAANVADECFPWLDAPVRRVASLDTPVPFNPKLEEDFLPASRLSESVRSLLDY